MGANSRTGELEKPVQQVVIGGPDSGEDSLSCKRAVDRIRAYCDNRENVVFEGERGVGKRYHASLLHRETVDGAGGAFVEVTPDTPNDVLRVILFDEERRLLSGKIGKPLPSLHGRSTLYLHDVDQFPFMNQILLSRYLIEQQQRPSLEARVIMSTTLPRLEFLKRLVESFSRSVERYGICRIPPLRDRLDEMASLVRVILCEFRAHENVVCSKVPEVALRQLKTRSWRDNVRELKYRIEEAAITSQGEELVLPDGAADEIDHVGEMVRTLHAGKRLKIDQSLGAVEKAVIVRALMECDFDQRRTARKLEMTEPNLIYRLKKFNIYIPSSR